MTRVFNFLFLIILLSSSCSRQTVEWVYMDPVSEEIKEIDNLRYLTCDADSYKLKLAYVEDAFKYIIFHAELESYHRDTLLIEIKDIRWAEGKDDNIWRNVINKNELLSALEKERDDIRKAKKTSTITNAVIAGLEVLAIAASPGGGASALFYAAESGVYIAEDRAAFNVASLSVDDEKKYIEDWVLSEEDLPPYEMLDFDLIIDRRLYTKPILFRALINNESCLFEFSPKIIEERF